MSQEPDLGLAQQLMTLAGLAYDQPANIPGYLKSGPLSANGWQIFWIAKAQTDPVNFAFIAVNNQGDYAIAIRGTYPDPFSRAYWDDASQDNPLGSMVPWPGAVNGAKIAGGTMTGFTNVLALSDGSTSLADTLKALPSKTGTKIKIYVTGHSLGGTLAPVLGLWLTETRSDLDLCIVPFAGMTPGNGAFADLFGPKTALADRVWRYNNTLDTVPYGWDRVYQARNFYQPAPQGGWLVSLAITFMAIRLWLFYGYKAIGTEIKLPGKLEKPVFKCQLASYVVENLEQHLPNTYLALLGAAPLPFDISFGSVVVSITPEQAAHRLAAHVSPARKIGLGHVHYM